MGGEGNFLNRLDEASIFCGLDHTRPGSVMVDVSLPGWRWEVEFMAGGSVDIERYRSVAGVENDPGLLGALLAGAGSDWRSLGSEPPVHRRPELGDNLVLSGFAAR